MKRFFFNCKRVLIDLDNTIIEENDYLFDAYCSIARYLSDIYDKDQNELFNFLIRTFEKEGRINLFDKLERKFNLVNMDLEKVLYLLRNVKLNHPLSVRDKVVNLLRLLKHLGIPFTIVTNGNVVQQKNKIAQTDFMDLEYDFDIIYANETSPKPAKDSFIAYCNRQNIVINGNDLLMIGDSVVDSMFAQNLGCNFLNVNEINIVDGQIYINH